MRSTHTHTNASGLLAAAANASANNIDFLSIYARAMILPDCVSCAGSHAPAAPTD